MKIQYIMILELKTNEHSGSEFKVIRLPETEDDDTTYLYEVLSFFSLKYYVHLCGTVPSLDCGYLSEEEIKLFKEKLIEYDELFQNEKSGQA